MIFALFQYQFLLNAVIAGFFASVVCGIIGVIVMEKRLIMMSGGISHASYGGVGLGYYLDIEPIWGAFLFSILSAMGVSYFQKRTFSSPDIIIALFWSMGMATGILLITISPGYPPDVTSYLFGDILTVKQAELYTIGAFSCLICLIIIIYFNYWKAYLFEEEFAYMRGINVTFLEHLLFILIAMSVVVLIRVVGLILILALLAAPPAIARMFTSNLKTLMLFAVLTGNFFTLAGLWISYKLNFASGASIVILAGTLYIVASTINTLTTKNKHVPVKKSNKC